MKKSKRTPGKFLSKAQWAWAFATHKTWAKKWARKNEKESPYKTLPRRKGIRRK